MTPSSRGAQQAHLALRDMTRGDVPTVRRIESAAYQDAWPARVFETELDNGFAHYRVVVEQSPDDTPPGPVTALRRRLFRTGNDRVLGFMGVWYMVDQLHLVTIAIAPEQQGRGLGHLLLFDCFRLAAEAELAEIVLEVRVSNDRARTLYEHFGFRRAGTLRAYYKDNDEDALVMLSGRLDTDTCRERLAGLRREVEERYGIPLDVPLA